MTSLSVQNIGKHFGERRLFDGVTFDIGDRDKIGLVGANGCGKTTLFRILTGELSPDSGGIVRAKKHPAWLSRTARLFGWRPPLLDEVLLVFTPVMAMEAELREITERLAGPENGDIAWLNASICCGNGLKIRVGLPISVGPNPLFSDWGLTNRRSLSPSLP